MLCFTCILFIMVNLTKIKEDLESLTLKEIEQLKKDGHFVIQSRQKAALTENLSAEKQTYITSKYINTLLERKKLAPESITQLNGIKNLLQEYNTKIDAKRLIIKKNLVCIDGYTLPTKEVRISTTNIENDIKKITDPWYAKALLTFTADVIWESFAFLVRRDELQNATIDSEEFIKNMNTATNKVIIKSLCHIVWLNSIIPIGVGKDGYLIYVSIFSNNFNFNYYYNFRRWNCLVSIT